MTTYRERREARAERLRDWAEKREAKSRAALDQSAAMVDAIPFGQPILVGHYSEGRDRRYRDRAWNTMGRGVEHARKAEEMSRKADNIEAAAERAIYDDDHDAADRLRERIAELEAERARIVAYNKSCRKAAKTGGTGDLSLLDDRQRKDIANLARVCPYQVRAGGAFPAYATSNLGGNINRYRKRLAALDDRHN
jgi:hypothetical protein